MAGLGRANYADGGVRSAVSTNVPFQGAEVRRGCSGGSVSELFPVHCPLHAPIKPHQEVLPWGQGCSEIQVAVGVVSPCCSLQPLAHAGVAPRAGAASGAISHCWGWECGEEQGSHLSGG